MKRLSSVPIIASHRASLEREKTLRTMGYKTSRVRLPNGDEVVLKNRPPWAPKKASHEWSTGEKLALAAILGAVLYFVNSPWTMNSPGAVQGV